GGKSQRSLQMTPSPATSSGCTPHRHRSRRKTSLKGAPPAGRLPGLNGDEHVASAGACPGYDNAVRYAGRRHSSAKGCRRRELVNSRRRQGDDVASARGTLLVKQRECSLKLDTQLIVGKRTSIRHDQVDVSARDEAADALHVHAGSTHIAV